MEEVIDDTLVQEKKIIDTDIDAKNGQDKCLKCGSSDIALNIKTGKLRCNFCRFEFSSGAIDELSEDITELKGDIIASGFKDIQDTNDSISLKCESCGSEVVIDTKNSNSARCHWCRNRLSLNKKIPNGAVPDLILPFKVTKQEAKENISKFINSRKFFANPKFKKEFNADNVMGIYLPYLIIDAYGKCEFDGEAEILVDSYYVKKGDSKVLRYDAERYYVKREFDIIIDDLTFESNSKKIDFQDSAFTNNIINAIMPFDTDNCVKYNSNYLVGYSSERRDINLKQVKPFVEKQISNLSRVQIASRMSRYNRGIRWNNQNVDLKATRWATAYLPVWVYSYYQSNANGGKGKLHYVAVNARTRETMGSIPIDGPKVSLIFIIIEIIAGVFFLFESEHSISFIVMALGFVYVLIVVTSYRNFDVRHNYENETKTELKINKEIDEFQYKSKGLSNSRIEGENTYSNLNTGVDDFIVSEISRLMNSGK